MTLKFEDGIIGHYGEFAKKRFGVQPLLGRLWGAALVSVAIPELKLYDALGPVMPSIYVIDVEPTGEGKSSPIRAARRLVSAYAEAVNKDILGPSSFTPQSFVEAFTGIEGTKNRSARPPRPNLTIIQDEASKWYAERGRDFMIGQDENLSRAWDGHLDPSSTIGRGYYEGMDVNLTIIAATSYRIFHYDSLSFFEQGAGCRFNWALGQVKMPEFGPNFFFTNYSDPEFEELVQETITRFKTLEEAKIVILADDSEWRPWANQILLKRSTMPSLHAGFRAKQIQQSLKFAMNYAASKLSIDRKEGALAVGRQDLRMSMDDCDLLFEQFKQLLELWRKVGGSKWIQTISSLRRSKLDIRDALMFAKLGRFTKSGLETALDVANNPAGVRDLVNSLLESERLRMVTKLKGSTMEKGELTDEEYAKFKKPNILPAVYEITKKGTDWLETNV